jgi:hypothetical protein
LGNPWILYVVSKFNFCPRGKDGIVPLDGFKHRLEKWPE